MRINNGIRGWEKFMGIRGRAGEILVAKKKSLPRCFSEQKMSLPRCFSEQKKSLPRSPPARPRIPIHFSHPLRMKTLIKYMCKCVEEST